ncbi:hypothetical protein KKF29_01275 [Patescibacteria group bacterium]|nr:hypothetical protein [Patescibacteria group bacterium]
MKITICGSVKFAERLVKAYKKLETIGHTPLMHKEMFRIANGTAKELIKGIYANHAEVKQKNDFIRIWYELIKDSDAILVCNFNKDGIKNYIGGNTFLEIGFAHVLSKKIYLLNPVPEVGYKDEILAMQPIILNGDLTKLK